MALSLLSAIGQDLLADDVHRCAALGLDVRYPNEILRFVFGCQTGNGGFSRVPVALPNIELTHQALEILATIVPEHYSRSDSRSR